MSKEISIHRDIKAENRDKFGSEKKEDLTPVTAETCKRQKALVMMRNQEGKRV